MLRLLRWGQLRHLASLLRDQPPVAGCLLLLLPCLARRERGWFHDTCDANQAHEEHSGYHKATASHVVKCTSFCWLCQSPSDDDCEAGAATANHAIVFSFTYLKIT